MPIINSVKAPTSWDDAVQNGTKSVVGTVKVLHADRSASSAYAANKAVSVMHENSQNPVFGIADGESRVDERYNINKRGILHHNMRFESNDPVITVQDGVNGRVAKNNFKKNVVSVSVAVDQNRLKTDPAYLELVRHQTSATLLAYANTLFTEFEQLAHMR